MNNNSVDKKAKDTSKKIKILIQEGKLEEAIQLTQIYPDDHVIQSQRISIAFMQNDLKTARDIAERKDFSDKRAIYSQRIKLELLEENFDKAEQLINAISGKKDFIDARILGSYRKTIKINRKLKLSQSEKEKNEMSSKNNKAKIEFIKTVMEKIYDNNIQPSDIQEITENRLLTEYDTTCILLAISDRAKQYSLAEKVYKKYKSKNPKSDELRKINIIMQKVRCKKAKIFDYSFYEEMLGITSRYDETKFDTQKSFEECLKFDKIDYSKAVENSLKDSSNGEIVVRKEK